jgi:hypothetical protein
VAVARPQQLADRAHEFVDARVESAASIGVSLGYLVDALVTRVSWRKVCADVTVGESRNCWMLSPRLILYSAAR